MYMRRLVTLFLCCLVFMLLVGCSNFGERKNCVEVIVDGDGQFPPQIVGTWKANDGGWEFVFERDGSISSAVISLGRVKVKPGETTTVPMILGGRGTFVPGKWTVEYIHQQRKLIVEIVIEHFRAELGDNIVKGKTHDIFVGSVSPDGRLWWADRFSYPEYVADTGKYHNYALPSDPNDNPRESLIFQKVTEP
jgi:hypothetical protein